MSEFCVTLLVVGFVSRFFLYFAAKLAFSVKLCKKMLLKIKFGLLFRGFRAVSSLNGDGWLALVYCELLYSKVNI